MVTASDPGQGPGGFSPAETKYADSYEEADRRSKKYRIVDPFPLIPRALLSSEHIQAYVRETGMIYPFESGSGNLKSASYEVRAGGQFIFWDDDGKKIVQPISRVGTFTLPRNSISYVQIEPEFLLPQYIAVRFNLRITHVHRGLLLGTGPLVDPGFHGRLLIPLHNLTSDEYTIRGDEGLFWMEFTKTSHFAKAAELTDCPQDEFKETEPQKNKQPPEYYFDRAAKNRPIRSSIPVVVADAERLARNAVTAAERAERTNRILFGVSILAIAGVVISLYSLLTAVNTNVVATHNLIKSVSDQARQAASDAKRAEDATGTLRSEMQSADFRRTADELQRIHAQLDDARGQIETLKAEVRNLSK
jgi:deoxycytidine triphosphate deaminase